MLFDIKFFVDTGADIRFICSMERDVVERDRTRKSVLKQKIEAERPMHLEFIEPSKRYAEINVPDGRYNLIAVDMFITKIRSVIEGKNLK